MKTVIVAGAGIMGLTSAWRLAQRGWQVTVFDMREAAGESSWAAAGMLAPGGEIESDTDLAKMSLRSLHMFPEFIRDLEEDSGLGVEYRRCGAIEVAMDDNEAELLAKKAARQVSLGISSEPCRYNDFAARFYPEDAMTDPLSIIDALLAACRKRNVTIRQREPVTEVLEEGPCVRTAQGEYRADRVLIAAGAWSSGLFPGLPRVYPVRGHLICYDLEPGLLTTILRNRETYLLQRESGTLIAGSSMENVGFERAVDAAIVEEIEHRAARLLPALAGRKSSDSWNGMRPATDEGRPVVGRVRETQVWTAYGHFRNGILLAPDTAETILDEFAAA